MLIRRLGGVIITSMSGPDTDDEDLAPLIAFLQFINEVDWRR